MKKYIQYFLDTFICHFSKHFQLKDARVKWLTYHLGKVEDENLIIIESSQVGHWNVHIEGKNNQIIIRDGADVMYGGIHIHGDNNRIIYDGCLAMINCTIRGNSCQVSVGKGTLLDEYTSIICMGQGNSVTIEEKCMFADKVEIWASGTHLITDLNGHPLNPSKPVHIGKHVWLGKGVCVMKGVTIGEHSVVGLGSVVTKDIPAYSIAAGNPARVVKEGTDWKMGFINI